MHITVIKAEEEKEDFQEATEFSSDEDTKFSEVEKNVASEKSSPIGIIILNRFLNPKLTTSTAFNVINEVRRVKLLQYYLVYQMLVNKQVLIIRSLIGH